MIATLRRLLGAAPASAAPTPAIDGRPTLAAGQFDLTIGARWHEGLPHPDWQRAYAWVGTLDEVERADAWLACERAWLYWLAEALGDRYVVYESGNALLLTTQSPRSSQLTLSYLETTLRRVQRLLEEMAQADVAGKEIMLVLADHDEYYRYISAFYPPDGEFAMSSGMHVNAGCGHFVSWDDDLSKMEGTIVHEMTHSLLGHRPIPAWLNEGIAVNTESRLGHHPLDPRELRELEREHRAFWTPERIQEFWCGTSYERPDEANRLSYDLGRVLVNGLAEDWPAFKRFVATADIADSGAAAAADVLDVDLGEFVRLFLGAPDGAWRPAPTRWPQAPQPGG